ncbi:MAG: hypothetical protein ABI672_21765, partial [Vicinamibacteria bacterium]
SHSTSYGIIAPAIVGKSPRQQPIGPLVVPGTYKVHLSAGGLSETRELQVTNDPRSPATPEDLAALSRTERGLVAGIEISRLAIDNLNGIRKEAQERADAEGNAALDTAMKRFDAGAVRMIATLAGNRTLASHLASLEFADLRPTESTAAAIRESCAKADEVLRQYDAFLNTELSALQKVLHATGKGGSVYSPKVETPLSACAVP